MRQSVNETHEHRRKRLQLWIDLKYGGKHSEFRKEALVKDRRTGKLKQMNQGELSSLLKDKQFGEKKARLLEKQAGMPAKWLDGKQLEPLISKPEQKLLEWKVSIIKQLEIIVPFFYWSKLDKIVAPNDEMQEYSKMLINTEDLKYPVSDNAFKIRIDTNEYAGHYEEGMFILLNPPDENCPKTKQTLLIEFEDGRQLLAKYSDIAGRQYLEPLERGLPNTLELNDQVNYKIKGYVICYGFFKASD